MQLPFGVPPPVCALRLPLKKGPPTPTLCIDACCDTQQTLSAVRHSRHCLLCDTTDIVCCVTQTMSAVGHSRHSLLCDAAENVFCVTQLCDTAVIVCCVTQPTLSAVSHSRQCLLCGAADVVCCGTQQTSSAVSHSRQCLLWDTAYSVCCVTKQTLWQTRSHRRTVTFHIRIRIYMHISGKELCKHIVLAVRRIYFLLVLEKGSQAFHFGSRPLPSA